MKKGWKQRTHKRVSKKGKAFAAGKKSAADKEMKFSIDGWFVVITNTTPKSQMYQASKDYKAVLTKDGEERKVYEDYAHSIKEFASYVKSRLEDELKEEKESFKLSKATKKAFGSFDERFGLPPMVYMDDDELEEEFRERNKEEKKELLRDFDFMEIWEEQMLSDQDDMSPRERISANKKILAAHKAHRKLMSLLKYDLQEYV